jgi:ElaB/YqjD/DUF883 family membrane-anchored ribosome-binding protein
MATASQKTTNPLERNIDNVSERAHDAVDRAAQAASNVAGRLQDRVETLSEKGEELLGVPNDLMEGVRDYVRDNPLQAVGMAVAAGYLLSMLMRSR